MHSEARFFINEMASQQKIIPGGNGLDLGGRNVNGMVLGMWPDKQWTVVDQLPMQGVLLDHVVEYLVADAADWAPDKEYNLVLCTEVFEHTPVWPSICTTAFKALCSEGVFIVTAAGPGRKPHSGIDGGSLEEGEYYEHILPHQLGIMLRSMGFRAVVTYNPQVGDVYAYAVKP